MLSTGLYNLLILSCLDGFEVVNQLVQLRPNFQRRIRVVPATSSSLVVNHGCLPMGSSTSSSIAWEAMMLLDFNGFYRSPLVAIVGVDPCHQQCLNHQVLQSLHHRSLTASLPLKNGGTGRLPSYRGPGTFQGRAVKLRGGVYH